MDEVAVTFLNLVHRSLIENKLNCVFFLQERDVIWSSATDSSTSANSSGYEVCELMHRNKSSTRSFS